MSSHRSFKLQSTDEIQDCFFVAVSKLSSQGKLDSSSAPAGLDFGHKSSLAFCFGIDVEYIFRPFCCERAVKLTAEDGKAAASSTSVGSSKTLSMNRFVGAAFPAYSVKATNSEPCVL